jgi:hypothetical protein
MDRYSGLPSSTSYLFGDGSGSGSLAVPQGNGRLVNLGAGLPNSFGTIPDYYKYAKEYDQQPWVRKWETPKEGNLWEDGGKQFATFLAIAASAGAASGAAGAGAAGGALGGVEGSAALGGSLSGGALGGAGVGSAAAGLGAGGYSFPGLEGYSGYDAAGNLANTPWGVNPAGGNVADNFDWASNFGNETPELTSGGTPDLGYSGNPDIESQISGFNQAGNVTNPTNPLSRLLIQNGIDPNTITRVNQLRQAGQSASTISRLLGLGPQGDALVNAIGQGLSGLSSYLTAQQNRTLAQQQFDQGAGARTQYNQYLNNPDAYFNSPVYQSLFKQVAQSNSPTGNPFQSGFKQATMMNAGASMYDKKLADLANQGGITAMSANAYPALQNANNQQAQAIGGVLGGLTQPQTQSPFQLLNAGLSGVNSANDIYKLLSQSGIA